MLEIVLQPEGSPLGHTRSRENILLRQASKIQRCEAVVHFFLENKHFRILSSQCQPLFTLWRMRRIVPNPDFAEFMASAPVKYFVDLFFTYIENFIDSFCNLSLLLWPFSWPFWTTFTSNVHQYSLVCWEFCNTHVPSSAQAILCQMHIAILDTITLPHHTYLA